MLANEEGNRIGAGNASDGREAASESNSTTANMPHAIATKQPACTQTSAHDARAKAGSTGKRPSEVTWHLPTRATPSCGISSDAPAAASAEAEAGMTSTHSARGTCDGTCDASWQALADGSMLQHQEHQEHLQHHGLLPSVVTWRSLPVARGAGAGAGLHGIDLTASLSASAGLEQRKQASIHATKSKRDRERQTSNTTVLCPCAPVPRCPGNSRRRVTRRHDGSLLRPVLAAASCARAVFHFARRSVWAWASAAASARISLCCCLSCCLCCCLCVCGSACACIGVCGQAWTWRCEMVL